MTRALCLLLMVVCGGWSAYGLHHFWDVVQQASAQAAGLSYVPVRSLADIDGPSLLMVSICVAIAFVEPLTFWVLGGTQPTTSVEKTAPANVRSINPSRRRTGQRALAAVAAAAIAAGTLPAGVPDAAATSVSEHGNSMGFPRSHASGSHGRSRSEDCLPASMSGMARS